MVRKSSQLNFFNKPIVRAYLIRGLLHSLEHLTRKSSKNSRKHAGGPLGPLYQNSMTSGSNPITDYNLDTA